ncbi:MAG: MG2 domain-containing protein [Planctomycetes bacterium]|nr:MG2 domain-containing protein [Planctomycetota bacterium]
MKKTRIVTAIILLFIGTSVCLAETRDALWTQVQDAINKGLPQTAVKLLDEIIPGALADQAWAEATKAICMKIAQNGRIQGGKAEEMIVQLQAEIAAAPEPMKPVMEAVLGHWYWQYFQQNRWRFMQRTQTAEPPGADITTWDLATILAEIDKHFTLAPAAEQTLKATPISVWDYLIEKGTVSDTYRPTLYDFLAFDTLSFYSSGEQAGALPQDTFEIMADDPIFAPVAEFLAWQPKTSDTQSAKLKAIQLYQALLAFHQNDADKTALIDADLERLIFGNNQAVGPEKADLYKGALERFVNQWSKHEIAARGLYEWANVEYGQGDYLKAHKLADQAWEQYPASFGGIECYNLIQQIEAKSASITTERVWNDPLSDIKVTYRNVTKVYFRAVSVKYEDYMGMPWLPAEQLDALLAQDAALQWSAELPATVDYKSRTETVAVPKGLAKGLYYVMASHDASFKNKDNQVSALRVWVSDLALVLRTVNREAATEGLVLNARTGEPVPGAKATLWKNSRDYHYDQAGQTLSDSNGFFRFSWAENQYQNYLIVAESGGDRLASESHYQTSRSSDPPTSTRTVFFTDRSLYRPGQTIHYKGICFSMNTTDDKYQTRAGMQLTVVFKDVNGQEIARQQHTCNDYGSFSGSFTAPRDRLMGQMTLVVEGGPSGSTSINVEEYKRPKFRVELEPPADAPKLGAEVVVPGKATAYTGASIGSAQVEWRVVRQVRFPPWCWWWRWSYPSSQSQAIAHGSTVTEADGSFSLQFTAKPDLTMAETDEPVFEFVVYADVTDMTGETRSDQRTVRAGYTALQASILADAWQTPDKPVQLIIQTQSLDGEGEPASGTIRIHSLKQPDKVARPELSSSGYYYEVPSATDSSKPDASDPETWEPAALVSEQTFKTDDTGLITIPIALKAGIYRATVATQDRFGKAVTARQTIQVVDPAAARFGVRIANYLTAPQWSVEPGAAFTALWGTGYDTGRAYVELECRGQVLRAWWTDPSRTQEVIREPVTEAMRGGFTLRVTYVRENRAYLSQQIVEVPWTNKQLTIAWERFRSLLEPGTKETWTAIITGPDAKKAVAEMVAGLYDASLDQYLPHDWLHAFTGFRQETGRLSSQFENGSVYFVAVLSGWTTDYKSVTLSYRHFPKDIVYVPSSSWGGGIARPATRGGGDTAGAVPGPGDQAPFAEKVTPTTTTGAPATPDLSKVSPRENLDETAFFFPHLVSGADGVVRMEFTMPEALTEWKFLGFAHDNQLRSGYLTDTTVTAKDLMVEPNPPRFVREGDAIEFTVKVSNQSAARQMGKVSLTLADARTLDSRDKALGNTAPEQAFDVPSKESRTFSWRLTIPDDCEYLIYKAVGATTKLSDGEEGYLPVLSRRILVQESLPLPIRGPATKEFQFTKLLESGQSTTLRSQSLTVQMVSQPAWYAVMALPYLMEYPHECSEQVFNRLYANTLASYIAGSDPKIRRIFDQWKATPALDSPLEKNEDLKSVALEETPWVRQAVAESEARKNVGILFDQNRLTDETARALSKLQQMQLGDGLWPWFPGCPGNEYITLYITTGFGRLRHLGVRDIDVGAALKALDALDGWMDRWYRDILTHGRKDENNLGPTVAFYLYGRSFFLNDHPVAAQYQEALSYWMGQARQYWLSLPRQSQGHLAIGLQRFGDKQTPADIMRSIKEFSVTNEEMGMFWRDTERSWWWYHAPIETQALMIEAFDEVAGDAQAVEDCRVWLLKQKQTQDWHTTKATADAIYALLLRGADMLSSDALVQVALGGQWIVPEQVEAGTGFYEERFVRGEITPSMGQITVKKTDSGVSWGAVHWQYLEDMSKVTPYEGTPLQLVKTLYIKQTTDKGQVLYPVQGPLAVGDELVVRIELRVDRDMEYVHMKDQRGSGTEPVDVLSRYRYQDGLGYYQSTRDTATHFFMDYLPKGTYVFEYSTRIQNRGQYQTGMASIECMYAPEFNSHSESFELEVR